MKKPQARSCSNGHHADWVREPGVRGDGEKRDGGRKSQR